MSQVEAALADAKKITIKMIEEDLKNGYWNALYFAKEDQIIKLIEQGKIDEDFLSRNQSYQEEMRCMMNFC